MTNWTVKILSLFLIVITITTTLFLPKPADAALGKSIVNVTACSSGGAIASWLSGKIASGLGKLGSKLTGAIANKLKLGGIFASVVPVNDAEFQSRYVSKETVLDIIARCTAREIFDKMVGNTLNVVRNHGRDGGPTFIQNWRNFTTNSQYRGENVFRAILSNTQLCDYFSNDFKTLFRANNKTALPRNQNTRVDNLDPYQLRANCTMPAGWSLDAYNQDFSGNGSWLAFAKLLEPQNNALGSYNLALEEINNQKNLEQTNDMAQAQSGGSFIGRSGRGAANSCLLMGTNDKCVVYEDIKTPGSILEGSVNATTQQEIAWITNVDELNEVITELISGLLNRILDLSSNDESKTIKTEDLPTYRRVDGNDNEPEPPTEFPTPPEEPGSGITCTDVPSAIACNMPNHTQLVQQVKDYLISRGIDTSGYCGAFEITKRVAWALRNEGAGILATIHSANCNGFAAGFIAYTDDSQVDILGDVGGGNTPSWNPFPSQNESGVYYVAPSDAGDAAGSYGNGCGGGGGNTGLISGYFSNTVGGVVLDYRTSNLCVDSNGVSGAIIRRNAADIFLITSNGPDLPAGTRIDKTYPGRGTYTYTLHDAGCGNPAKQKQLGSVNVTAP